MLVQADTDASVYLALLFVVLGAVGIAISVVVPNPYSRTLPLAALVAATLFLVTRDTEPRPSAVDVPARLFAGFYFVILAVTVLLYGSAGNQRTLTVHAFLLACYVLVAILIVSGASKYLSLSLVFVTGIAQRAMAYYSSPLYLGNDVFSHNRVVAEILASGSMEPLVTSKYFYAPFYHLLIAVQRLFTDLSVRHAAFVTIAIVLVGIPMVALYRITGRIWNEQTAAFSALLYTSSDFAIHWAITPQVTSLGIAFYALTFMLLVSYVYTGDRKHHLLYVVAFVVVTLTHQVSTVITLLAVVIFLAVWAVREPDFRPKALWLSGLSLFIVLVDFEITKFSGPADESASFLVTVLSIWRSSLQEATLPGGASTLPADAGVTLAGSAALNVWHVAGTAILLGLAMFGVLHWIASSAISETTGLAFGVIVGVLFPIVLLGPLFGLRFLIPWRWFAFLYVPLAILAAPGVTTLATAVRARFRSAPTSMLATVAVLVVLLAPYVFFMGGNAIAARDGPPLDDAPGAERYAVTAPEVSALEHSVTYVPQRVPIVADFMFAHNLLGRHYERSNVHTITLEDPSPSHIAGNETAILINRSYMQSGHVKFRYGTTEGIGNEEGALVHGVVPVAQIDPHRREVVYDAGSVELIRLSASTNESNRTSDG